MNNPSKDSDLSLAAAEMAHTALKDQANPNNGLVNDACPNCRELVTFLEAKDQVMTEAGLGDYYIIDKMRGIEGYLYCPNCRALILKEPLEEPMQFRE